MTQLAFDIFPAATPLGSRLVRLTNQDYLLGTGYRHEGVGTGSGQIVISSLHAACTATNFAKRNFVQVVDLDLGGSGEKVGAFFLESGDFQAVSQKEEGGRILTFGGPGALSYIGRAVMWNHNYDPLASGPGFSPRDDGIWHWITSKLGDDLVRIFREAEASGRPQHPIPDMTRDFTAGPEFGTGLDSSGAAWVDASPFQLPVGMNYIDAIQEWIKLGFAFDMSPDLEMHAWQPGNRGTDRSSATFASGKVRFEKGINIDADLSRALQPSAEVTDLLVEGINTTLSEMVEVHSGSSSPTQEGWLQYGETSDATVLTHVGEQNLAQRLLQTDKATFPFMPGTTPLSGIYTPSPPGGSGHFWVGDIVRLHTGTSAWDYNEVNLEVAAINWVLRAAGDWEINVELGAAYYQFQGPLGLTPVGPPTVNQPCSCGPIPAPACIPASALVLFAGDYRGCSLPTVDASRPCTGIGGSQTWAPTVSNDPMGVGLASCAGGLSHDSGSQAFAVTPGAPITATAGVARYNDFASIVIRFFNSSCAYMSGQDLASDAVALDYFSFTDVTVSGTVPAGATSASVILKTGAFGSGVGLTGALGYYSVNGGTDPLCGAGAWDGSNVVTYGADYIPGPAGQYIPAGSQLPAPAAGVVPITDAGSYFTNGFVEGALQELGGEVAAATTTTIKNLTNKSGGSVAAGDVVIVDTANDDAFTTTTSAGVTKIVGVAQATIANNASGPVALEGYVALVNVTASVTRGHYGSTAPTAKKAVGAAARAAGAFCQFLKAGTSPDAVLFGVPDAASSPLSTKGDLWGYDTGNNRIPVGADDKVLTADSTAALGVSWKTVPGPTAAQVRDAGRWEVVVDADGSAVLDGSTPPNWTYDWTTT